VPRVFIRRTRRLAATNPHHLDIGALEPRQLRHRPMPIDAYAEGLQFKAIKVYAAVSATMRLWQLLRDNIRIPSRRR